MPGPMTAGGVYGTPRMLQPDTSPVAPNLPGQPAPTARTEPLPKGPLGNPVLMLVGLIGLAILLTQLTVRGSIDIEA